MMDSSIQQLLDKISAEGIQSEEPLLLAELTCGCDVENAVMYSPEDGGCEDLFLSSEMGFDDTDGMEDSTAISRTEDGEPLVELTFSEGGTVEVGDFEGFSLVVWNRSGERLTIAGDNVEPDDFLMISVVFGEELDRVMRALIAQQGGESNAR